MTAAGDVPLGRVQETLARQRQWLAADGDESRPVGDLVEENSTGPLRLGFGGWRDILLGCQFRNGRGELISAGGQTMKNVAGYDLTKFMVGQRGIFGKIVTITARTYRLPDGAITARFPGALGQSIRHLASLLTTPCRPQWSLMDAQGLICGYLGDAATLDYITKAAGSGDGRDVERITLQQDAALRRSMLDRAQQGDGRRFRASLAPTQVESFINALRPQAWAADAAFGVVWGNSSAPVPKILATAAEAGGIAGVYGDEGAVFSARRADTAALLQRLKAAFDPSGTLAPLPAAAS